MDAYEARPRLLFVCSALKVGGAERQLTILAPALRARGFDPLVVALREKGAFFCELGQRGVPARFVPVRSRFDAVGIRRAIALAAWRPAVVISQSLDAHVIADLIARRAGAPHVVVHHKQPEIVLAPRRRLLMRFVARRATRVVAVSAAQIADLEALGFSLGRLRVIENGVPEAETTRAPLDVRAGLGLARDDFVVILVANLRPEKRTALFAEAVISANSRDSRVRGVIAGDGPDLDRVRAIAGTTEALHVLGTRSDVADLIAAADVACLTSSAEALPMVILEAMSLGKPVLATDVGGVAEAVIDGKTGVVLPVELGETLSLALCRLAADPEVVAAMGRAARVRYLERYSADRMADRYADVLRETIDNWQHSASKPG